MLSVQQLSELPETPIHPSVSTWKPGLQMCIQSPSAHVGRESACHLVSRGHSLPSFFLPYKVALAGMTHPLECKVGVILQIWGTTDNCRAPHF